MSRGDKNTRRKAHALGRPDSQDLDFYFELYGNLDPFGSTSAYKLKWTGDQYEAGTLLFDVYDVFGYSGVLGQRVRARYRRESKRFVVEDAPQVGNFRYTCFELASALVPGGSASALVTNPNRMSALTIGDTIVVVDPIDAFTAGIGRQGECVLNDRTGDWEIIQLQCAPAGGSSGGSSTPAATCEFCGTGSLSTLSLTLSGSFTMDTSCASGNCNNPSPVSMTRTSYSSNASGIQCNFQSADVTACSFSDKFYLTLTKSYSTGLYTYLLSHARFGSWYKASVANPCVAVTLNPFGLTMFCRNTSVTATLTP